MQALSGVQYEAIISAIKREPFHRPYFDGAARAIRQRSAITPDDRKPLDVPRTLTEWRADPVASIALVERHQAACDAAWRCYWSTMSATHPKD
jgi:hypothetical protein